MSVYRSVVLGAMSVVDVVHMPATRFATCILSGVHLRTFVVLLLLVALTAPASAQESGHSWSSSNDVPYPTQEAALRAYHLRVPGWEYANQIERVTITENAVQVLYWPGVEASELQPWAYGSLGGPLGASEADVIATLTQHYDQKSITAGCAPNTTVWRASAWGVIGAWPDGIVRKELARFDATYDKRDSEAEPCSQYRPSETVIRERKRCANPHLDWNSDKQQCRNDSAKIYLKSTPLVCDRCGLVGNPMDVVSGNKYEPEPDIALGWIAFSRTYHSVMTSPRGGFGAGWTHSHNLQLAVGDDTGSGVPIALIQADGAQIPFRRLSAGVYESTLGSGDRVVSNANGWNLEQANRTVAFDLAGRVIAVRNDDGNHLSYQYDVLERLVRIVHSTGRSLDFAYATTTPMNRVTAITYDGVTLASYAYSPSGLLVSVQYGGSGSRLYHYEDARFPTHLTGITAEDGQRFSTFSYDGQGRVVASEHAGGVARTQVNYSAQGGAIVTHPSGGTSNYALTPQAGSGIPRKVAGVSDAAGTTARTYDAQNVDFRRRLRRITDARGVVTEYDYVDITDTQTNQAATRTTQRVAVGTSLVRSEESVRALASNRLLSVRNAAHEMRYLRNARQQVTHVQMRDLATNAERTTLLTYCEQSDVTAGTCPIVGQLRRVDGPRSGSSDVVDYTYRMTDAVGCDTAPATCAYRKGDLWTVTNALGHVAEALRYDGAGRPLSMKDANGVVTDLVYNSRGWVTTQIVRGDNDASELDDRFTHITYTENGLPQTMQLPAGETMTYAYDAAHRLIGIADTLGNTVAYTLNGAGDRMKEDTHDATNTLRKTMSAAYDTLGRLQSQTNGLAQTTTYTYDAAHNLDTVTDALGRVSDQTTDALGRVMLSVQDASGAGALQVQTAYHYDALDRLTQVTDPKGLNTIYTYNGFGELTQLTSPDTGTTISPTTAPAIARVRPMPTARRRTMPTIC